MISPPQAGHSYRRLLPALLVWGLLAFITNHILNIGFAIGVIALAVLELVREQ